MNHEQNRPAFDEEIGAARRELRGIRNGLSGLEEGSWFSSRMDSAIREVLYPGILQCLGGEHLSLSLSACGAQYANGLLSAHGDIRLLLTGSSDLNEAERRRVSEAVREYKSSRISISFCFVPQLFETSEQDLPFLMEIVTSRPVAGESGVLSVARGMARTRIGQIGQDRALAWIVQSVRRRHERFGGSFLLLEPDLLESPGALADVEAIRQITGLMEIELEGESAGALEESHAYLLKLRNGLHFLEEGRADGLTTGRRLAIAPEFVQETEEYALPEELLLRDYYRKAEPVFTLLRELLEKADPKSPSYDLARLENARLVDGELPIVDGCLTLPRSVFGRRSFDSGLPMRFFSAVALHGLPPAPPALRLMQRQMQDLGEEFLTSAANRERFLVILRQKKHLGATVRWMREAGVLEAYLPEFLRIRFLPRLDHYHQFTVDEHILRSVDNAGELVREGSDWSATHAGEVAAEILRWDLLVFALIIHDVGKGVGRGHAIRGAGIAQTIASRIGLPACDAKVLSFLVLNHQKLTGLALTRDVQDPALVEGLADEVPDLELLRMLYVVTCCDLRAVSEQSWTEWRGSMLTSLYERASAILRRRLGIVIGEPARHSMVNNVAAFLSGDSKGGNGGSAERMGAVARFLEEMPAGYRDAMPRRQIASHMRLLEDLGDDDQIVWEAESPESGKGGTLAFVARNSPSLIRQLSGFLRNRGVEAREIELETASSGMALGVIHFEDSGGMRSPDEWEEMRTDLQAVLVEKNSPEQRTVPEGDDLPISFAHLSRNPPTVRIENEEGMSGVTHIEIEAPYQIGFLHSLTSALDDQRLNTVSLRVHVASYRVVAQAGVTDWENNRLPEGPRMERLREALIDQVSPRKTFDSSAGIRKLTS